MFFHRLNSLSLGPGWCFSYAHTVQYERAGLVQGICEVFLSRLRLDTLFAFIVTVSNACICFKMMTKTS